MDDVNKLPPTDLDLNQLSHELDLLSEICLVWQRTLDMTGIDKSAADLCQQYRCQQLEDELAKRLMGMRVAHKLDACRLA